MTVDIEKLRYTLEQTSIAVSNILKEHPEEVDVSWISGLIASIETTLDAIED